MTTPLITTICIVGNLRENPVNLSIFLAFFRNAPRAENAGPVRFPLSRYIRPISIRNSSRFARPILPRADACPVTPNAGKCAPGLKASPTTPFRRDHNTRHSGERRNDEQNRIASVVGTGPRACPRPPCLSEAPVPVLTKDNHGNGYLRCGRPRGAAPTGKPTPPTPP